MPRHATASVDAPKPAPALVGRDFLQNTLSLTAPQLAKAVQAGHVPPPIRLGNTVRWRKADIDKLLAA